QSHSKPEAARYNDLQRRQNGALPPTSRARARQPGPANPAWTSVGAMTADMVEHRARQIKPDYSSSGSGRKWLRLLFPSKQTRARGLLGRGCCNLIMLASV